MVNLIKESKDHLQGVNETYYEHCAFSIDHGLYLIKMGIMSIVHGIIPCIFPFTLPRMVIGLYDVVRDKHGDSLISRLRSENTDRQDVRIVKKKYFKK